MLIAVRVVVVTTLLLAALIIQYTVAEVLPIDYLYATAAVTYVLTLVYIGAGQLIRSRIINLAIQLTGDLLVETMLVYFTGALDSPFSFLYLVSIITASMMLYRRGGLFAASGAAILYGALGALLVYHLIPLPEQSWIVPTFLWSPTRLYLNIATNFAGFYATAFLTSYISEKLQKASVELDEKGRIVAALRALNQNVVESIPSGLITLSPDGIASFVNPAGCQILGTESRSVIGHHVSELEFFRVEEWEDARRTLASESVVRVEKNNFRVGDEDRSLGYAVTPLRTLEGSESGYTLIFQDLTEMKQMEAELRLKDRMAAVGELSAGIAHEIRNPLAAIAGSVQVLKKSNALSQQEQRLMSIILKESERLNKSIADFLRFVRPQDRRPTEFDVAASLSETLDLLANSPEVGPDHRIERQISPPAFTLVGDADQIRQVFWNLARNAFQAMPNGGILRVSTDVVGDTYRIFFSDSGRGMSEVDQRRLFQPFRTNFPTGTGLGMAISYRIVQAHGGNIDVASRPGIGTTITVSLPRRAAELVGSQLPVASAASR
ncbi:MAG TPA: ATP-binding protein [Thermoanaerobaculia bacterium]|nr:ATP-binding protein [Thermoanaerobaculia bacterium]